MTAYIPECDIYGDTVPEDLWPLRELRIPYSFIYFNRINSTNDTAKAGDYPDRTAIIADTQDVGRGRFMRDWYSPPGVNIHMSIVLRPVEAEAQATLSLINTAAALAMSRALATATSLDVWPKWPNDVYIGTKKAGGILSESLISGARVLRLVIGIGLNVNTLKFPVPLQDKATSLLIESGIRYKRGDIIALILREFDECRLFSPDRLISAWSAMSKTINSYVPAGGGRGGVARALNEDGSLVIELDSGQSISLNSAGEVTSAPCH
ncbi:MAG: biotin--[acetyl-CoA-carboxylase] ligase [Nitrospirae bacterium]|nr:biotin--[acetyl-CoA-carboxylase] ligase [Nitrospirota bacterium]